jgi:hypothetical protein
MPGKDFSPSWTEVPSRVSLSLNFGLATPNQQATDSLPMGAGLYCYNQPEVAGTIAQRSQQLLTRTA